MRVLKLVSGIFSVVGVGMLVASAFIFSSVTSFVGRAAEADGVVTGLERARSSSSSGDTWRPVVEFSTAAGRRVEFTSNVGSSPPSHSVGDAVTVLYEPDAPEAARIKSFFQLWFGFLIVLVLGAAFAAIGLTMIVVRARTRKRVAWLQQHGVRMKTSYSRVELNQSLRVNGRSPWQIITQSADPASNTIRVFESENIWFDPTEYIRGDSIDVLVDRNDPKRYVMDISFLPKVAE